jgi:hypothetical protein
LLDRDIDEIANNRVDISANVADLRELGRFNLDERRVGQAREPACNLGLADAGRPIIRMFFGVISERRGSSPAGDASDYAARPRPHASLDPDRRCVC